MLKIILLVGVAYIGYNGYKTKFNNPNLSSDNKVEISVEDKFGVEETIRNKKKELENRKQSMEEEIKNLGDKQVSINQVREGLKKADGYYGKYKDFKQGIKDKLRNVYEKIIGK